MGARQTSVNFGREEGRCYSDIERDAKEGDAEAQYQLGVMFEQGKGVKQSFEMAMKYYEKAAKQGNTDAQYNIGNLYFNGHGAGAVLCAFMHMGGPTSR